MPASDKKVWISIPTYEEVENIELVLRRVRASMPDATILVIDDNSPDGTAYAAEAMNAELGNIEVLRRPGKMGLGGAYRAGHAAGLARGYDVICQMDADLSHDPADLPRLLAAIERGADLAIGSRYTEGGSAPHWPKRRLAISRTGNLYASTALNLGVKDTTAGFRAYRAEILRDMEFDTTKSTGYGFAVECTYRLVNVGGKIEEVPICFTDRVRGNSKMSLFIIAEAMTYVTWWALRDRVFRRVLRKKRR